MPVVTRESLQGTGGTEYLELGRTDGIKCCLEAGAKAENPTWVPPT